MDKSKVSLLTPDDLGLIRSFVPTDSTSYYDCFPYMLGANNSRVFTGHKYVDGDILIVFATKYKGKFWKIYKTYGPSDQEVAGAVFKWWQHYRNETDKNIGIHNLREGALEHLTKLVEKDGHKPKGVQRFFEDVYDVGNIRTMPGKPWRRLRPQVNLFHRQGVSVRVEQISNDNRDAALAVMATWVQQAKARGVVQLNQSQYRYALVNCCEPDQEDSLSYIYYVGDKPKAIQLSHLVSKNCWAHTAGFVIDREIKGLGEYVQHYLFADVVDRGVTQMTDGLRTDTKVYKSKWNPIKPPPIWFKVTLPGLKVEDDEYMGGLFGD